jgi:hypothetical protein
VSQRAEHNYAVYYCHHPDGQVTVTFVHVDNMSLVTSDKKFMATLKKKIGSQFEIVDSGDIKCMLSIELTQDRIVRTISMSQSAYIDQILKQYRFADIKPLMLPVNPNVVLTKDQSPSTNADILIM